VAASAIEAASVMALGFATGQVNNAVAFAIGLLVGAAIGLLVQRSLAFGIGFTALGLVRLLLLTGLTLAIVLLIEHAQVGLLVGFLGDYVRGLIRECVGEGGGFIVPLAMTLGFYILIANWLDFFPLADPIHPANADLNQTLAMALLVIIVVQAYSLRVLGLRGYFRRFTKPFEMALPVRIAFIPLNIVEEVVKPVTLSLRLFGNIFAGALMVYLIGSLITFLAGLVPDGWPGTALGVVLTPIVEGLLILWKAFDIFFVGRIQ